jgi:hypothetical protein
MVSPTEELPVTLTAPVAVPLNAKTLALAPDPVVTATLGRRLLSFDSPRL